MWQLQDLATTVLELWNLMDTPLEEQQMFQNVTCNIAASEHEMKEPGTLSADFINYVSFFLFWHLFLATLVVHKKNKRQICDAGGSRGFKARRAESEQDERACFKEEVRAR